MPLGPCDAVTGAPVCTSFDSYYLRFPNSEFIYTGSLNDWLESMRKYFLRRLGTGNFRKLEELMAGRDRLPYGGDFSNIHFAVDFNHGNFEEACYRRRSPSARFLSRQNGRGYFEFDARAGRRDGLCAFIGASVPFATFPRLTGRRTDEPFGFCLRP
jgi:hypothetical protein